MILLLLTTAQRQATGTSSDLKPTITSIISNSNGNSNSNDNSDSNSNSNGNSNSNSNRNINSNSNSNSNTTIGDRNILRLLSLSSLLLPFIGFLSSLLPTARWGDHRVACVPARHREKGI